MEILIGASLIVAFIAGIAALFAPCCITVLLPAYLGSVFKHKSTVVLMTFMFFLGLLVVFLPLGLGVAGLGKLFSEYHNEIFVIGALFLLFLGFFILSGRHFSLPFQVTRGSGKIDGASSVFILGIFSGAATLCCAPVLAGVIALSALPNSIVWGGVYALVYVLGMTVPLFIIAFFVDKTKVMKRFEVLRKKVSYTLFGKRVQLAMSDVVSGSIFVLMGVLILYLAKTNQLGMGDGEYQTSINIFMANLTESVNQLMVSIPPMVVLSVIGVAVLGFIFLVFKKRNSIN